MFKNILVKLLKSSAFIIIILNLFLFPKSYASMEELRIDQIFEEAKGFIDSAKPIDDTINEDELKETSEFMYNMLFLIAVIVAIITAMILGIQFMISSADEKAKVKEALVPFVVGCAVVFGAFTIWKIVVNIGNKAENAVEGTNTIIIERPDGTIYKTNRAEQTYEDVDRFISDSNGGTGLLTDVDTDSKEFKITGYTEDYCSRCGAYANDCEVCPECSESPAFWPGTITTYNGINTHCCYCGNESVYFIEFSEEEQLYLYGAIYDWDNKQLVGSNFDYYCSNCKTLIVSPLQNNEECNTPSGTFTYDDFSEELKNRVDNKDEMTKIYKKE